MTTFTTKTQKGAHDMLAEFIADGFAYSFVTAPQRGETEWTISKSNDAADFRATLTASRRRCDGAIAKG